MTTQTPQFDDHSEQIRHVLARHGCGLFIRGRCEGAEVRPSEKKPSVRLDLESLTLTIHTGSVQFRVPSHPAYSLKAIQKDVRPLLN